MVDPVASLKAMLPCLEEMRDSDFDGMSHDDIVALRSKLASLRKEAVHGTGSNWVMDDSGASPYKTSPLVNYQGPEFGGRWRDPDFAGGSDQRINEPSPSRLDKELEWGGDPYVVRFTFNDGEKPSDELALEVFGEEGKSDGTSIYVVVNGFEEAVKIQGEVPGSTVEKKGES